MPFHPDTYDGEDLRPTSTTDDFGITKTKQATPNVVRWRWAINNKGEKVRQSNSKIVRWSDGTLCLYIGNESFTISESTFKVPYVLCAKGQEALDSHGSMTARLMFQPNSKSTISRVVRNSQQSLRKDSSTLLSPSMKQKLEQAKESQDPQIIKFQNRPQKSKRGLSQLDVDFLEEGTDLAATKATYKLGNKKALENEGKNSRKLNKIKSNKKSKFYEEDEEEEESENSFIASEGSVD